MLTLAPLKAWAVEIWAGQADTLRKMAIAFAAAVKDLDGGKRLATNTPGPTVAVLLALQRLGWRAESCTTWISDRGARLDLREVCPRSLMVIGKRSV